MVAMTVIASFCLNSSSYHGIKSSIYRGNRGSIDVHGRIGTHLLVKDPTHVNATTLCAINPSRIRSPNINISSKMKMMLDQNKTTPNIVSDLSLGSMVDGFVFRQYFNIRTYEIGKDGTISIETIMNLLQETSVNHFKEIGILGDGLGVTLEMCKKNLIWVMAKLHVAVERYPVWGDVIQIDTWKGFSGNMGITSDWMFCDGKTGEIMIRASCVWLIMNLKTRKLSKLTDEVRAELDPHFICTPRIVNQDTRNWPKRDENIVDHACNGLAPKWSDLDVNQHVNNAKYIKWIFESVPMEILENYELANMTLRYCRECRSDNVLQSHTFVMEADDSKIDHVDCEHLLQLDIGGGVGGSEIMKGRTTWRLKYGKKLGLGSNGSFPKESVM